MKLKVYTIDTAIGRLQELRQELGGSAPLEMCDGLPVVMLDSCGEVVVVSDYSAGARLVEEGGELFAEFRDEELVS
jgi:hypothetical protein